MKNKLFIVLLAFLVSCSPKISTTLMKTYTPLAYNEEVFVLSVLVPAPENAVEIGQFKIGDTGFSTNCDYDTVVEKAKIEARKAGGNVVKITKHQPPNIMGSSCHRIAGIILKVDDVSALQVEEEDEIIEGIDYAILNIYRYPGAGALVGYDLHLGDSVLCRVKNRSKSSIQIHKLGRNTLWAKTESKVEVPINIEAGRQYYLRAGLKMGAFVGRPSIELVDPKTGRIEFEALNEK